MGEKKLYFSAVRELIKQQYGTFYKFAVAYGKGASTLSKKLNGELEWTRRDMKKVAKLLGISIDDIGQYFFYD